MVQNKTKPSLPPKWVLKRAIILWKAYGNSKFTFNKVTNALKNDDPRIIALVLSNLKKNGWLEIGRLPEAKQKKYYKFRHTDILDNLSKIEIK